MDYKKRVSHVRGVYPTQDTSRMRRARLKQKGRSRHQENSKRVVRDLEERNVGTKRKNRKQGLTSAEDLTIMLSEGRDSPYTIDQTKLTNTL